MNTVPIAERFETEKEQQEINNDLRKTRPFKLPNGEVVYLLVVTQAELSEVNWD